MLWKLLTDAATETPTDTPAPTTGGCTIWSFLPWILVLGIAVVFWFLSRNSQKKREQEINDTLDAIQPGNKVKTIGGICGVVVEVCPEDNTFILETGSENSGKSYIKFDKKSVYQTDAVPAPATPVEEAPAEETPAEDGEHPFEEISAENAPAEETPVEEASAEEVPAEEKKED